MTKNFWTALATALILSGIFATIYVVAQQNYRQSANDPQIQMSEDAAAAIDAGQLPAVVVGEQKINLRSSLAPFLIVFDMTGRPLAASVQVDGHTPVPPVGVFMSVQKTGEDRVTWQTKEGLRVAMVLNKTKNGYVLAGRSLREVEVREANALNLVAAAWLLSLFLFGFILLFKSRARK